MKMLSSNPISFTNSYSCVSLAKCLICSRTGLFWNFLFLGYDGGVKTNGSALSKVLSYVSCGGNSSPQSRKSRGPEMDLENEEVLVASSTLSTFWTIFWACLCKQDRVVPTLKMSVIYDTFIDFPISPHLPNWSSVWILRVL